MSLSKSYRTFAWSLALGGVSLITAAGCQSQSGTDTAGEQFRPKEETEAAPAASNVAQLEVPSEEAPSVAPKIKAKAGQDAPAAKTAAKFPPAPKSAGVSEELAEKITLMKELAEKEPPGKTEQQKRQNAVLQMKELVAVAEEIVQAEDAPMAATNEAMQLRYFASKVIAQIDPSKEANANMLAAAEDLSASPSPEIATLGKTEIFGIKVGEMIALKPEDGKPVLDAIDTLLAEPGEVRLIMGAAIGAASQLERAGYEDDAIQAFTNIGDHFAKSKNPAAAIAGRELQLSALTARLRNDEEGQQTDELQGKIVAKTEEIIQESSIEVVFDTLHNMGVQLESFAPETARAFYGVLEQAASSAQEPKVVDAISTAVKNANTRLDLIGKPFEVEGVLLDGKPFNWQDYRGKVVLVDFWATWCGPCLQEMSNIKKNYTKFKDQGFEVVGVNLDEDLEDVSRFFEVQELPWATVVKNVGSDNDPRGFSHPTAERSGVDSIPFVVLIDREGVVDSIHVRGPKLEDRLTEMLAQSEEKAPAKGAARSTPVNSLR